MTEKTIDFAGPPDAKLVAEEVRQRIEDLNRALEHASRQKIAVHLSVNVAPYDNPSEEVPIKIVIEATALHLTEKL